MSLDLVHELIGIELLLNEYSGKRYHLRSGDDWFFSLVEVEKIGKEKVIVECSASEMVSFIKRHLKVSIDFSPLKSYPSVEDEKK